MTNKQLFYFLTRQKVGSVEGVHRLYQGRPSFKAVVLLGTHGKEINAGLAVYRYALDHPDEFTEDLDLTFALGNKEAARLAIEAQGEEWKDYRFTPDGKDMNRLPANLEQLDGSDVYEWRRAAMLRAVITSPDVILDVHTTDGASTPAGLGIVGERGETDTMFSRLGGLTKVYTDVCAVQATRGTRTRPHSGIYGARLALELEMGQSFNKTGCDNAVRIFRDWAVTIGILKGTLPQAEPKVTYRVVDSVMAPDKTYEVVDARLLTEHAAVTAGEVLLRNPDGKTVTSPCDGEIIWCPDAQQLTRNDVQSEIWFVVQKAA